MDASRSPFEMWLENLADTSLRVLVTAPLCIGVVLGVHGFSLIIIGLWLAFGVISMAAAVIERRGDEPI